MRKNTSLHKENRKMKTKIKKVKETKRFNRN